LISKNERKLQWVLFLLWWWLRLLQPS
jgi:hypothetical protein